MGNTLEIACSTSAVAAALAYLAYKVSEGQSTLPVEVNGEMVFVPKPLIDALYDVANFSVRYNMVIKGFHEGPRVPEDQYAVILQAEKKWQRYVSITRMTIFMNLEWVETLAASTTILTCYTSESQQFARRVKKSKMI